MFLTNSPGPVYKPVMAASQRTPNQTLVAFACHQELLRSLDLSRARTGADRSLFIRQAICAELHRLRVPVPDDWILSPDRAKKVRYAPAPSAAARRPRRSV